MTASQKEQLALVDHAETETESGESREVFLREGRTLKVSDAGTDQLVEIRSESGALELRVKLTEEGPVLQMESVKLSIKAAESVDIASKNVSINASETLQMHGSEVELTAEHDLKVTGGGDVRIVGTMIYLN